MELLNSYKQFKVGKIYIHKNPLDIIKIESIVEFKFLNYENISKHFMACTLSWIY